MSSLNFIKQQKFEKLFDMQSGYVLNFSNRTFQAFVIDSIGIDIYEKYPHESKARILRNIIKDFSDAIVGKLLFDLLEYFESEFNGDDMNASLLKCCKEIAINLKNSKSIKDIYINHAGTKEYHLLINEIKNALNNEKPEIIVDRLHTLCMKFIKDKAVKYEIDISNKSLNALFGLYIKELERRGCIEYEITKNILKHNISILEKFNEIRNNRSLAHDNILINKMEAEYIVNNIIELINFIDKIENNIYKKQKNNFEISFSIEDLPF